jgi:tight adherence protein C
LLFPLILFFFPSLFVILLGPAVIQIIRILLPRLPGH